MGLMGNFIDTADSPSGDFALEQLFKAADTDGSGKLDKEELQAALKKLGFSWMEDDKKGDKDGDGLIDLDEFKKLAPTVLRQNLMKLAKENGAELNSNDRNNNNNNSNNVNNNNINKNHTH